MTTDTPRSLAEGFGLTVAEGMWKGRPIAGSAVGGTQDQFIDGTGILLPYPTDLAAFGSVVRTMLDRSEIAEGMGAAAKAHVAANFVGARHRVLGVVDPDVHRMRVLDDERVVARMDDRSRHPRRTRTPST